jgi:hypothetical protein
MPPAPFADALGSIGAMNYALSPNGHAGPASYVQISGSTGGDAVQAVEFGMKNMFRLSGGISSDGLYQASAINPTNGPASSIRLRWVVIATGSEVAAAFNLSGSKVNLEALGR